MARGSAAAGEAAGLKRADLSHGRGRGPGARRYSMAMTRRTSQQLTLPLARDGTRRGGKRRGGGRKLATGRRSTPHRPRPRHFASQPVHVTLRACLGPLRSQFLFPTVRLAIACATRRNPSHFRVVHFSVQSNHLHLIVEAADARSLSAGVRSIAIRVARLVNRLLFRTGRFLGRSLAWPCTHLAARGASCAALRARELPETHARSAADWHRSVLVRGSLSWLARLESELRHGSAVRRTAAGRGCCDCACLGSSQLARCRRLSTRWAAGVGRVSSELSCGQAKRRVTTNTFRQNVDAVCSHVTREHDGAPEQVRA
jgi:hypothetical protein